MENQEKFKEGIESYRRRIITELSYMNSSIDGFVDVRNMKFELRHLIQSYRRSLEKCNMYISGIEVLIEDKSFERLPAERTPKELQEMDDD